MKTTFSSVLDIQAGRVTVALCWQFRKKTSFPENFLSWRLEAELDHIFFRRSIEVPERSDSKLKLQFFQILLELPIPSEQPAWSEEARFQNHPGSFIYCFLFCFDFLPFCVLKLAYTKSIHNVCAYSLIVNEYWNTHYSSLRDLLLTNVHQLMLINQISLKCPLGNFFSFKFNSNYRSY